METLHLLVLVKNLCDMRAFIIVEQLFSKITAFLKSKCDGNNRKKSKILSINDTEKFLLNAPNESYILLNVALIFVES